VKQCCPLPPPGVLGTRAAARPPCCATWRCLYAATWPRVPLAEDRLGLAESGCLPLLLPLRKLGASCRRAARSKMALKKRLLVQFLLKREERAVSCPRFL